MRNWTTLNLINPTLPKAIDDIKSESHTKLLENGTIYSMCILFLAINQHPEYPVVICANRDEFHARPTKAMHYWPNEDIYAGKDLQAGGTWLAIKEDLNFAALTNYRLGNQTQSAKLSRGALVVNAVTHSTQQTEQILETTSENYAGFNLIYGNLPNLKYFDSVQKHHANIPSGFHSLCNGAMDDIWPKMAQGQQALEQYITKLDKQKPDTEQLFSLLKNQQQALDEQLPDTGVGIEWERKLSSIFIQSGQYGTRSSCIILVDRNNNVELYQREFSPEAEVISEQSFVFKR